MAVYKSDYGENSGRIGGAEVRRVETGSKEHPGYFIYIAMHTQRWKEKVMAIDNISRAEFARHSLYAGNALSGAVSGKTRGSRNGSFVSR